MNQKISRAFVVLRQGMLFKRSFYISAFGKLRLLSLREKIKRNYLSGVLDADKASNKIKEKILSGEPFAAGKLGDVELHAMIDLSRGKQLKYGSFNLFRLENNAGFFWSDSLDSSLDKFKVAYADAVSNVDYLAVWYNPGEDYLIKKYNSNVCPMDLISLEPYLCKEPWSQALTGKKVLVISPFVDTIRKQYETNREKLFVSPAVLPKFDLICMRAVQTIGSIKDSRFQDWNDALEYMKSQIASIDFDVALVGCGAYSLPLCSFIKSIGKQAIHTGGTTQVMFGIKGSRWDNMPAISSFYNENWVYVDPAEQPKGCTSSTKEYWK